MVENTIFGGFQKGMLPLLWRPVPVGAIHMRKVMQEVVGRG
jgi:hypothetical protein